MTRSTNSRVPSQAPETVIRLYQSGKTTQAIANELNMREQSVRVFLRREGIQLRPQIYHTKIDPERIDIIVEAVLAGNGTESARKIAGISVAQFHEWVKKGRAGSDALCKRMVDAIDAILNGSNFHSRSLQKYSLNEHYFDTISTPDKAWLIGFIATDGNVSQRSLAIKLQREDRTILETIAKMLDYSGPIYNKDPKTTRKKNGKIIRGGPQSELRIGNICLVRGLLAAGIHPNKTFTVKPWDGPDDLLTHYWRGAVDGDGTICLCRNRKRSHTAWRVGLCGNKFMVSGFRDFVRQHLGPVGSMGKTKTIWAYHVSGTRLAQKVVRIIYPGNAVALPRKQQRAKECLATAVQAEWWEGHLLEDFERMRVELGSWPKVAACLGTSRESLGGMRRRMATRH
jgi:hypothetical protein